MFKTYRANELSEVPAIATLKLKVIGEGGESKWLTITPSELEKIIAVLEPEDYRETVPAEIRVSLGTAPLTPEQGAELHGQIAMVKADLQTGAVEVAKVRLNRLSELVDDLLPDADA
jgi:hypothetical protein